MNSKQINVRSLVYKALMKAEKNSSYANIELSSVISEYGLSATDRAFFTHLFYGVTERRLTLNYLIKRYSKIAYSKIDKSSRNILRIAIYQLFFMSSVPQSAAVNEAVKLASVYASRSRSFINALLRKVCEEINCGATLESILECESANRVKYLSLMYSLPEWIIESYRGDYPDIYEDLVAAVNSEPSITLRANTLKQDVQGVVSECIGKLSSLSRYTDDSFILEKKTALSEIELIDSGYAFVQDSASTLAVKALGARPGETVYDMCACPGGKSFSCAIDMQNTGTIISFDIHESKLSLIESGANRLGIDIIQTRLADSSKPIDSLPTESADRIICDVPCSGLGVISKKADMRYRDEESAKDLPALQYSILENASRYLKKGGTLVYSTCTLKRAENEEVFQRFLLNHSEFSYVDFSFKNELCSKDGMLTLFPSIHNCDGFFIAKLTRK